MTNTDSAAYRAAYEAGLANRVPDLTVRIHNGTEFVLSPGLQAEIIARRDQAASFRRAYDAPGNVRVHTALRNRVGEVLGVGPRTAREILMEATTVKLLANQANTPARRAARSNRPESLELAVSWDRGWKVYTVTGTRHAYYLLRKLADRRGFRGARLNDVLVNRDGSHTANVIHLSVDDITGSDSAGKYRALLDRNNAHYDLARDDRAV